ncbi:hypothetical protein LCGC14_2166670 [marine sediment metagenome]|uniref:Uncharacterized protein n=1 Tax=marine sediment metagenome TaxID=412755 RepID=A0A0F9G415_9ZZZZ
MSYTPPDVIHSWIYHDLDLDFTGTDFDTKAECNAEGILFSDADTPYPTKTYVEHAGTWAHVASNGWKPVTADADKGPSLIIPLARPENWELEIVFDYSVAAIEDTGQLILFAMTASNHIAFFGMSEDNNAGASTLQCSMFTNDGDNTYTSRYAGGVLAGTGQRTIKIRNLNGTYAVWDDDDDAWHDYEGRQSTNASYASSFVGLQARKGANTMATFEIETFKLTYL